MGHIGVCRYLRLRIFAVGMMKPKDITDINQARVTAVQDYIRKHYGEELKLSELAAIANVVPTTLCHLFKNETGCTVSDFISEVRISRAEEMLIGTDETVRKIAFECGFSTLTNFNRLFKRLRGCTPTELRERHQKTPK